MPKGRPPKSSKVQVPKDFLRLGILFIGFTIGICFLTQQTSSRVSVELLLSRGRPFRKIDYSPDGTQIAVLSKEGIKIHASTSRQLTTTIPGEFSNFAWISKSQLWILSDNPKSRHWLEVDVETGVHRKLQNNFQFTGAFSATDAGICVGTSFHEIEFFGSAKVVCACNLDDFSQMETLRVIDEETEQFPVSLSLEANRLAVAQQGRKSAVRVWEVNEDFSECNLLYEGDAPGETCVSLSKDGKRLLSVNELGASVIDLESSQILFQREFDRALRVSRRQMGSWNATGSLFAFLTNSGMEIYDLDFARVAAKKGNFVAVVFSPLTDEMAVIENSDKVLVLKIE